jgi:D-beta-D-heptose 7-phosphate kinase/D-beta-D-heptose 1-phosphate adenosyltransferase
MKKILVIGESCTDRFIYGNVNRLSPEAPIPVFIPKYEKTNKGMAGNVVENYKKLMSSESTIELITQNTNITKTRYVEDKSNHPFIRVDEGEDNISRIFITEKLINSIKESDLVIVSDYDKGFLTEEDLIIIDENSNFSVLDTKKKLSEKLIANYFDFIKLNEKEFQQNYTEDDIILQKLIITLGPKGAIHKDVLYPSESPRETIDVSGAGDTFTAAFAFKYLETKDVSISVTYANKLATKVVSKRGVTTV